MSLEVRIKKAFPAFTLDVDFAVGSETLGFLGASGCGKSLTMRCVAGIETPDEGRIVVNGKVFYDSEQKINLSPQERKTALLFQNYMLFPNLTIEQNVAAGIDKSVPKEERDRIVDYELRRFGLVGFNKRYPVQLSGGQQQRVALARMLAAQPDILMLDEPFSALDAHLKGVLEQNLTQLFEAFEGTILYVSHDIDEALRFCDRIAVVEAGHIMEIADADSLINAPQSTAALKLSGCKNATEGERIDDHTVRCRRWGIDLVTDAEVPQDVKTVGVRAGAVHIVDPYDPDCPSVNVFRVRADRSSDARFERLFLLGFLDRADFGEPECLAAEDDMKFLHQHMFMRIDKHVGENLDSPQKGDEFWVHIPPEKLYLVCK